MKRNRKTLLSGLGFLVSAVLFSFCSSTNGVTTDCVDPSKKGNGACPMVYAPVCGCDNKTYGNDCEARNAGVLRWSEGVCK